MLPATAWLTAYRMLTSRSRPDWAGGDRCPVQAPGGGVATAAIVLAKALGHTVFCTSRVFGPWGQGQRVGG